MRRTLTDQTIRAMQPPPKGYTILWDASLRGFGCRISQAGTRAFVVLIASGRPYTIGRYPALSLYAARSEAKRLLAEKTLGRVRPTHTAFEDARQAYLTECEKRVRADTMKPSTLKNYRLLLVKYLPFGRQSIADVSPRQILRELQPLTPSMQEHVFRAARTFFRWATRQHLIDQSPIERMASPPLGRSRTRVLSEDELRAVWTTARAGTTPFHVIVALLVATGQRRGEIAALQWDWIKEDWIEFPTTAAKNHRAWTVPLCQTTRDLFSKVNKMVGSPYVFPAHRQRSAQTTVMNGWSKAKAAFDRECGVIGWTLHDCRRTFATNLQRIGVRLEVTEALLNHVSGSRSGIVGVYQQHRWEAEKREAIRRFEAYLTSL